jgi:hypothetical protein
MTSWREERRTDRASDAAIARDDAIAAAKAQAVLIAAQADAERTAATAREDQARKARQAQAARRAARRDRRRKTLTSLRRWAGASVVDLLIYPLALVSAAMAVPAMSSYGVTLYGPVTGWLLAAISELGMWAFALAVQISRRRTPDRPVWALQLGIIAFAGANMALNFVHGLSVAHVGGPSTGGVMAIVSVAGVVAHQLAVTGARRSRTAREAARLLRRQRRHQAAVARLAVRAAVADVAADGAVTLVYRAGRFAASRSWTGRARLVPAPVTEQTEQAGRVVPETTLPGTDDPDSIASEAASWLTGPEAAALAADVVPPARNNSGTAQTPTIEPGTSPDPTGSGTTPGSGADLGSLLARIRAQIAAGALPANPSRRAIQRALKVRATTALEVKRALDTDPGNPGAAGQPARL